MATHEEIARLARIEAKIDHLLDRSDRAEDLYHSMDARVRHVEQSTARHGAFVGLVSVALSAITTVLTNKIA